MEIYPSAAGPARYRADDWFAIDEFPAVLRLWWPTVELDRGCPSRRVRRQGWAAIGMCDAGEVSPIAGAAMTREAVPACSLCAMSKVTTSRSKGDRRRAACISRPIEASPFNREIAMPP